MRFPPFRQSHPSVARNLRERERERLFYFELIQQIRLQLDKTF